MREMSLREIQKGTLGVLIELDKVCKELGVKYFLIWGTLLGAIRHNGYIPWDDDLDIAMFPEDYRKLCSYLCGNDTELEIHNMDTCPECFYNIARVCEKEHILKFKNKKYTSGLFIDIYVLHGLGKAEDLEYWNKRFKKYPGWRSSLNACMSTTLLCGRNPLNKLWNLPFVIGAKILGKKYFIKKFEGYRKFDINESEYVGVPQWTEVIFEKKDFDEIIYTKFEGIVVPIPAGYENFLRTNYGDYMVMPPENERHPQHGYIAYEK